MRKFIIAPTASRDLNKIADYFLTVNITAGEKLFQFFNQKIKQLTHLSIKYFQDLKAFPSKLFSIVSTK